MFRHYLAERWKTEIVEVAYKGSNELITALVGGEIQMASPAPAVDDIVLLDPVCAMTVDRAHVRHLAEHDGIVYAFCSIGCRTSFIREPTAYLPASVSSAD